MRSLLFAVLCGLSLAGCEQQSIPAQQPTATVVAVPETVATEPASPEPVVAPAATNQPGVSFAIVQVQGDCNPETPYRARLTWKIDDPTKISIVIRAESTTNADMATHDSHDGWAETENWVWQGMPFYLIDRKTNETLAMLTAGPESCN